jgi:hypothetical protein
MRKPRHNPEKPQNKWGKHCPYGDGTCEMMVGDLSVCKGDRHNCVKQKYRRLARINKRIYEKV